MDAIANVVTHGQKAQKDKLRESEVVPEAYAKEPPPLIAEDLARAQDRDRLCLMSRETVGMIGSVYSINTEGLLVHT